VARQSRKPFRPPLTTRGEHQCCLVTWAVETRDTAAVVD
jgi:hypothetical protein